MERPAQQHPARLEPGLARPRPSGGDNGWAQGPARGANHGWWRAWRSRPALAATALALGLLAGIGYWLVAPASYQAAASLLVQPLVPDPFGASDPARLVDMATEVELAQSSAVAAAAGQRLGLSPQAVRAALVVQSPPGTQVLTVGVRAGSAAAAADGAQAVAEAYLAYREASADADADRRLASIQKQIDDAGTKIAQRSAVAAAPYQDALRALFVEQRALTAVKAAVGGRVISKAVPPADPTSPKASVDIPVGGLVGALAGVVLTALPRPRRTARASTRPVGGLRTAAAPARPGPARGAAVTRPGGFGRPGSRSAAGSRPGVGGAASSGPAEPGTNRVLNLAAAGVPAGLLGPGLLGPGLPAPDGAAADPGAPSGPLDAPPRTDGADPAPALGNAFGPGVPAPGVVPTQAGSPRPELDRLGRLEQPPGREPSPPTAGLQPWYRTDRGGRRGPVDDRPDELGVDLWDADPEAGSTAAHPGARAVTPRG